MIDPDWQVVRVHPVDGGWAWELAHRGLVLLVAAEPIRNPARCAIEAEEWRRRMATGEYVLDQEGRAVPKC